MKIIAGRRVVWLAGLACLVAIATVRTWHTPDHASDVSHLSHWNQHSRPVVQTSETSTSLDSSERETNRQDGMSDEAFEIALRTIERYCLDCHSEDYAEAEIDLSIFRSAEDVKLDVATWQRSLSMLTTEQMPPPESEQPTNEEREQLVRTIRNILRQVAERYAGDPGPVTIRRLSNSQYDYSICDLTGLESLALTAEFPVDGAAGEGFTNVGDALVMSPSLLTKYLDASKQVGQHVVLLPDGIRFSPYTSRRDWTDEIIQRIRAFYRSKTIDDGEAGRVDLSRYVQWLHEHRDRLTNDRAHFDRLASSSALNAKYLWFIYEQLNGSSQSFIMGDLSRDWRSNTDESIQQLIQKIDRWQNRLWTFNAIGHIGREGGPEAWMTRAFPIHEHEAIQWELAITDGSTIEMPVSAVQVTGRTETSHLVLVEPTLVGDGRIPIPVSHLPELSQRVESRRSRVLAEIENYLETLYEVRQLALDGSALSGEQLMQLADQQQLDQDVLIRLCEYLNIDRRRPVQIENYFERRFQNVGGYEFINGWGRHETPSILSNSSENEVRIPGLASPRSVFVHPSPTQFVAIAWQSPIDGQVEVDAIIHDAHGTCGNGVAWSLIHRYGDRLNEIEAGEVDLGNRVETSTTTIHVRAGEAICLIIEPRDSNHGCDLTKVDLSIRLSEQQDRHWKLADDLHDNLAISNPRPDKFGNDDVWHFYVGNVSTLGEAERLRPSPSSGSLLFSWMAEQDSDRCQQIASQLSRAIEAYDETIEDREFDKFLSDMRWVATPNNLAELISECEPSERFGSDSLDGVGADDWVWTPDDPILKIPSMFASGYEVISSEARVISADASPCAIQVKVGSDSIRHTEIDPDTPVLVSREAESMQVVRRAMNDFQQLFPAAFCYTRIVPVDEVVTLTLFHREDNFLKQLILDESEIEELDRLWEELRFVSQWPSQTVLAYRQIVQFATQDRPDLVEAFGPMEARVLEDDREFQQQMEDAEFTHLGEAIRFASLAWRRELTDEEVNELSNFYQSLRTNELEHHPSIQMLLTRILTSPDFLYRFESAPDSDVAEPITASELAVRLSYFLWSSIPDRELNQLSASKDLLREDVLIEQVDRMLNDAKIRRLAIEFACQWLHLRDFDQFDDKNESLYPEFAELRDDMYEEIVLYFESMFRENRSVMELIDSDETYLNQRLAQFYGAQGVEGDSFRRVGGMNDLGRGGVLGMASFLASQSGASRTSPILRGNWIYETLLGEKLPRPPADVPVLPEELSDGLTAREMIEQHSSIESCARCHDKIDPFGMALEQFDAIGRTRDSEQNVHVRLTDQTSIEGLGGLQSYLNDQRRHDVVRQFCRKLLGFALGRAVQLSDEPLLEQMVRDLEANEFRVQSAVRAIVLSPQFRQIRGRDFVDELAVGLK